MSVRGQPAQRLTTRLSDSNQYIAGSLIIFAIGVCFRDQLARIQNRHLLVSLVASMALSFGSCVSRAVLVRMTVSDDQMVAYLNAFVVPAALDSLSFCAFTYYNVYRALMLVWPDRQKHPDQCAVMPQTLTIPHPHLPPTTPLGNTVLKYFKLVRDPLTQRLTMAIFVYISTVDSVFFVITQWRIITVLREANKAQTPTVHYGDAILRGVCFVGASFLFSASLGRALTLLTIVFAQTDFSSIQMTEYSDRIRKLVTVLQRGVAHPVYVDERNSGGTAYGLSTFPPGMRAGRSTVTLSR
ncbi:hypothetical protein DFJ73DRAFT_767517 [Zopfochytrium polystomum]|nr:hypothetical protein DFJ73DRAFT_767517 [Zopfochytrium polystomum]